VSLGPDGQPVNVNADEAAHALAEALGASSLELVSDVPGVKLERDQVASRIAVADVAGLIERALVRGGMVPKLRAAVAAVEAGVGRVRIGDLAGMTAATATVIARA
jgi:acetylglutamate kinase